MNLLLFNLAVDRDHTALGFTTDWINELASHCERITVITMYRGRVEVADNVDVLSAGLERGWSKPRRVLAFYTALARALRAQKFDCCFSHMIPLFTLMAGPVLKARGIPQALWYAHNHVAWDLGPALAFADRALASTATAFPIETDKLRVIGQGIDTHRFRPPAEQISHEGLRFLSIGRLDPIKNVDLMIRALRRARDEVPDADARLVLIGEASAGRTDYVEQCRRLARDLDVEGAVEWQGAISFADIHNAYSRGDVFLSANDNGLDKAILEAMACGLPVVAMHPAVAKPLSAFYSPDREGFVASTIAMTKMSEDERRVMGADLRRWVEAEHGLAQLGRRIFTELDAIAR